MTRTCVIILLGAILRVAGASGAETAATLPADIGRAIADLGHPDVRVRERATYLLWEAGDDAVPALTEAAASDDPETRTRAGEILLDIRYGLSPLRPPEIAEQLRAYRFGDGAARLQAVAALDRAEGPGATAALARLMRAERDEHLRKAIFEKLRARGQTAASALIAEGDRDLAGQLLRSAAVIDDPSDNACRAYAAFLVLRDNGRLQATHPQTGAAEDAQRAAHLAAWIYRAAGTHEAAIEAARKTGHDWLVKTMLMEAGRYDALADLLLSPKEGFWTDPLGHIASSQRLAGRAWDSASTLGAMRLKAVIFKWIAGFTEDAVRAAEAHLASGQPDQAVDMLIVGEEAETAVSILIARQQFARAFDVAAKAVAAGFDNPAALQAHIAANMALLGDAAGARALFDALRKRAAAGNDARDWAMLVWAQACGDARQDAVRTAAEAMARFDSETEHAMILGMLFPERGDEARGWCELLPKADPTTPLPQLLHRVHAIVTGAASADELRAAADQAMRSELRGPRRHHALCDAARSIERHGPAELALQMWMRIADESTDERPCVRAASILMRRGDWQAAADMLARAIRRNRSSAPAHYLRGKALERLGRAAEADSHIRLARLLPLADDARRAELLEELSATGLHEDAAAQADCAARLGQPGSPELEPVVRHIVRHLELTGRYLEAADVCDRYSLARQMADDCGMTFFLWAAHAARRLRAMGLLTAGRVDAALAEANAGLAMLPGEVNLVIDIVPLLRAAGKDDDARRLIERALGHYQQLISSWPHSAELHNKAAWLLARCRWRLDEALAHARRAVELSPRNCAAIDTLAEVHFQLGNRDDAIAAIRRCIELEPGQKRHRVALERIEKLGPESPPPPE